MRRYRLATALAAALIVLTLVSISSLNPVSAAQNPTETIFTKEVSPYDMEGMLASGEIDGAMTYEPWATDMVVRNAGDVLLRSADMWPNHPSYVMLMDEIWAQRNPDLAARIIRANMDAEQWINQSLSNPGSNDYNYLIDRAANFTGFSTKVVTEALTHIKYTSAITNQTKGYLANYTDAYLTEGLITNEMMTNHSYATSADFANNFTNLTYMDMAQQVAPSSTIVGTVSLGWASNNIFMLPALIAMDTSIWGGQTAFEKYGVQATSPEPNGYKTSALAVRDLIVGNVSVAYTAVCPAVLTHLQYNLRTIMVSQVAAEGTALIVARNINGVQDLAGKIIANPDIVTIQHIFLYDLAKKNGFVLEEIQNRSNTTS